MRVPKIRVDYLVLISCRKKWASKLSIVNLEHSHIHEVYAVLNNKLSKIDKDEIFLMVDYSSMSRNWYAAILNYCLKVCTKK